MPDPEPAPPRRPFPVFHVAATFAGTLCVVTLGLVALGLSLDVPAFRADIACAHGTDVTVDTIHVGARPTEAGP